MSATPAQLPSTNSSLDPPAITSSSKILASIDDIVGSIESILESSTYSRQKFHTEWDRIQTTYSHDIESIDRELSMYPPTYELLLKMKEKQRKDDDIFNKTTGTDHALNFYLQIAQDNDAFMENKYDGDNNDSNVTSADDNLTCASSSSATNNNRRVDEDEERFDSREKIFQKMDEMKDLEMDLERQLSKLIENRATTTGNGEESSTNGHNKDDDDDDDEDDKENELKKNLETCRARNCKATLAMISAYKPCVTSSRKNNSTYSSSDVALKRLGIELPSIQDMLDDVESRVTESFSRGQGHGLSDNHNIFDEQQDELNDAAAAAAASVDKNERDTSKQGKKISPEDILNDPYNLHSIHDLPITKPNDDYNENTITLKNIVESNTQSLDELDSSHQIRQRQQEQIMGGGRTAERAMTREMNRERLNHKKYHHDGNSSLGHHDVDVKEEEKMNSDSKSVQDDFEENSYDEDFEDS